MFVVEIWDLLFVFELLTPEHLSDFPALFVRLPAIQKTHGVTLGIIIQDNDIIWVCHLPESVHI